MTDNTVDVERVEVVRWRCPFCPKSYSGRVRAREHLARCWYNPAARSCKTCRFYDVDYDEPEVGYRGVGETCGEGVVFPVDGRGRQTLAVGCPVWAPRLEVAS